MGREARRGGRRVQGALVGLLAGPMLWAGGLELGFEAAAIGQRRNSVQISNEPPNTRFDLAAITGEGPFPGGRISLDWNLAGRHRLRFIIAPLRINETGVTATPIVYQGQTFQPGEVQATYRFDSYRASWRYRLHEGVAWTWDLGATLNVRDAEIRLAQGALSESKRNTGLVPLLAVEGQWRFAGRWRGILDVEGLAAPQGRAIDAALKVAFDLSPRVTLEAGVRVLEGGADNEELYTFARFDQAVVGVRWKLP